MLDLTKVSSGPDYNSDADPLVNIASGLHRIAFAIQMLGNGGATTNVGAIEGLAMKIEEAANRIADALSDQ